jgi:hypothetical protein
MAPAKARVVAALLTPNRHSAVFGVGLGRDGDGNPTVVVQVEGDEQTAQEVRELCYPNVVSVDLGTWSTIRKSERG